MSAALPPPIVAGELVRLQTRQHVVALTFDGGGNAASARSVLAVLRREHVTATFFLTGHFVKTYPALARAIGRRYPVGNHTVNHVDLRWLSSGAVQNEITQAQGMIARVTGRETRPYFRFPYGARDARTLRIVHRLGYESVRWTVDTLGWMGSSVQTVSGAVRRVVAGLVPGEIVMMHLGSSRDGSTIDARALPAAIRAVRARGYRFVTLAGVRAQSR
jgi:peptidoglycan/xylan/chitin deacetylase (PgdA/CDA1 family)